jgi:D-glycero-D-manno-heptose 1,7-bisphosphate phosphatase
VTAKRVGVFLDRDGTINEERNYIRTPDELHLFAGAADAIRRLNLAGLATCVISNQSGIARGFLTENDLGPIHARLTSELAAVGAKVDRILYCPHHPTEGEPPYRQECPCRKPKTGMIDQGARELHIDLQSSFLVGDSIVDMQAARSAGVTGILVLTGYGKKTHEECLRNGVDIAFVAETLVEAVDYILTRIEGVEKSI